MLNLKDKITNVFAYITSLIGLVQAVNLVYMQWTATASAKPTLAEWVQLVILVSVAVVSFFTGKTSDGKSKSTEQVIDSIKK